MGLPPRAIAPAHFILWVTCTMDYRLELSDSADEDLRKAIAAPLLRFNRELAGPSGHRLLVITLREVGEAGKGGAVAGGLWGATGHGWLYTQMLFVPESRRGKGLGEQLMQRAESEAQARGCRAAWVDTQFGARSFYEKLGYALFGELPGYPKGFTRSFLSKQL